jgi:ABC-2 type transport system ATP-binding protein
VNVIDLKNVTKTFSEHTAVDDLTLSVPQGSIYGFIGPNGSGKTTTLRMIMNIFRPDRGDVRVFGETLNGAATARIGYLPEERGLYKRMKVRDLLRFYGGLKRGQAVNDAVDRWLRRLDLLEWGDRKVEALSKGMAQKVQFIAAVVADPELVILDEPFTGLDPVNTDVLRSAVLELQKKGTTVIFSTHDMNTAERMCDFIFMIFKGRKVLDGTLDSIQDQYGNDTLRIRCNGGRGVFDGLNGVDRVTDFGKMQELHLTSEANPHEVATAIMQRTEVWSFEIAKPSLHDIFVRIAGPEAREVNHE